MNKHEAQEIAAAVNGRRPDWGTAGIMAALAKVQHRDATHVRTAAIAATRRTDQHSPAVIALDGAHWNGTPYGQHPGLITRPPEPTGPRCDICNRTQPAHDTAEAKLPTYLQHPWTPTTRRRAHLAA